MSATTDSVRPAAEQDKIAVSVLVNNTAAEGFGSEHGLSLWISHPEGNILFDTGQSSLLIGNALKMGIDLSSADAVVLSHGHYDHTGGLSDIAGMLDCPIYMHSAACLDKFKRVNFGGKYIGMPDSARKALAGKKVQFRDNTVEVLKGVFTTGSIPRPETDKEERYFYLNSDCTVPDLLTDDQSMFIELKKGVLVILGCTHSGLENTLKYIAELTGGKKVSAIFGGLHLSKSSKEEIESAIGVIKKYGIERLYPLHCTGESASSMLAAVSGSKCIDIKAGETVYFDL